MQDDEQYDADERLTGEVGSEGGTEGEVSVSRQERRPRTGSEAGETLQHDSGSAKTVDRVGDEGAPKRRSP